MNIKHGKRKDPVYSVWRQMLTRCNNPKFNQYADYGGRGIRVCEAWRTFANFYSDMGDPPPGMSIERKNNEGDYEPSNCVWATREEQRRNRRDVKRYAVDGRSLTLVEWSAESGIALATIWARINKGWEPKAAIFTPPIPQRLRGKNAFGAERGVEWSEQEVAA